VGYILAMSKRQTILILDNIRSVYNVGSIFRTADAAGISKIFLVGETPAPVDRFGRKRKDLAKVALGAENNIEWEYSKTTVSVLNTLKKQGFYIVAIEQDKNSIDYKKISLKNKNFVAFVLGSETKGLAKSVLKKCDVVAEVPMMGKKECLNVSVSFGVVVFRILNI
jgi:tRNA G18 (ribose-2'-O)-methylase SpoU